MARFYGQDVAEFDLKQALDLLHNSEWFSVPPSAPNGQKHQNSGPCIHCRYAPYRPHSAAKGEIVPTDLRLTARADFALPSVCRVMATINDKSAQPLNADRGEIGDKQNNIETWREFTRLAAIDCSPGAG